MARVMLVGIDPADVDFSDPALPPGMTADTVRAGIMRAVEDLSAAGHDVIRNAISADPYRLPELAAQLARDPVDCVVIGGGVRIPPRNLMLFEALVNVVARAGAAIALTTSPIDAAEAVARVVPQVPR